MTSKRRGLAFLLTVSGITLTANALWIDAKAVLAQHLMRRAWSATEPGGRVRPWPWADTFPVARLSAADHDVDLIVLAGGSGRTMAFGPGHLDGSVKPGGFGNSVISGHRDTHFAFLEDLHPGDRLTVERPGSEVVSYVVAATAVVDEHATWVTEQGLKQTLTLVTCYPFRSPTPGGNQRYVVWADAEVERARASNQNGGSDV